MKDTTMNKKRNSNKLCSSMNSEELEDIDESSILGTQAKSSVRGAMSDYADSTIGAGVLVTSGPRSITHHPGEGRCHDNIETSTTAANLMDDDTNGGGTKKSFLARISIMIDNLVSRVSRSASSLLNQHSPNINDILEDNTPPPRQQDSTIPPDDNDACGPNDEKEKVFALREEVILLKKKIQELEDEKKKNQKDDSSRDELQSKFDTQNVSNNVSTAPTDINDIPTIDSIQMLRPDQISRYSRQLLLNDGFGVQGQKQLLSSSILVIGAGGIGSSVLLYLAASGVGHITIVDYDNVEMSNLHRQVIHRDENASKSYNQAGMNKALSAKQAMLALNPTISVTALNIMISASNALELVSRHDVVVDACDNPLTRYLLNDACILAGKTLVSGSAMGTEGQLTVYNYQPGSTNNDGETKKQQTKTACYRCLYPNPNPAEGCKSCSDNGVLGMVPGTIGILQAVEVIKIVTGIGTPMHDRLMMYDALHCSFLNIKKPPSKSKCAVCSQEATIKTMADSAKSLVHVRGPSACAMPTTTNPSVPSEQNISCANYNKVRTSNQPHILLDVRVQRQYEMCSLDGSINVPLEELQTKLDLIKELSNNGKLPVYCLCRRGIASAEATRILGCNNNDNNGVVVYNIEGGLTSWVQTVDPDFPQY